LNKEPRWYGLEVLPVYVRISRKQLKESRQQLDNFEDSKPKSHLLTTQIIDRLLKGFFEKNQSVWLFEEQYKRWSQDSLSEDQLKVLTELQKNVEALKLNNEQLLSLARELKNRDPSA
jgi:hypothetical protein